MRVVVVGGGIAGSFTAYFLGKMGLDVTLVSTRPRYPRVGLVLSILLASPADVRLAARSLAIYRALEEEAWGRLVHPFPVYEIFPPDAALPSSLVEEWRRAGERVERLVAEEARRETGLRVAKDEWVLGGGRDYVVSVSRAIAHIHRRLRVLRGEARLRRRGGGVEVIYRGEALRADAIVLAAGPWNKALGRQAGLELPLTTYGARALLMLGPRLLSTISLSDNVLSFYSRPTDKPLLNRLGAYLAGDGNLPGAKPGSRVEIGRAYTSQISEAIARRTGRRPLVLRRGGGVLEMGLDHFPIAGLADPEAGLYVIGGLDGYGATIGPALAEKLARTIAAGGNTIDSPCHDIARFNDRPALPQPDTGWEPFLLHPPPPPTASKKCLMAHNNQESEDPRSPTHGATRML